MVASQLILLALLGISSAYGAGEAFYESETFNFIRDDETNDICMFSKDADKSMTLHLGVGMDQNLKSSMSDIKVTKSGASITFGKDVRLDIEHPFPECTRLTWTTPVFDEVRDCIDYGSASWFGGPELLEQVWPVNKLNASNLAMVTSYENHRGIVDRYWVSSEGTYFFAEPSAPLFIDSNTAANPNQLCFVSKDEAPFYQTENNTLRYTVCSFNSPREAQLHAITNMFGHPTNVPDELMFRKPIWSTWARYKRDINESLVMQFAQEIIDNGFSNSQIEIDDDWETCYGELEFSSTKFPDPKGMVDALKQMGYRVTLWVHPFINSNCPLYNEYLSKGYFVKDLQGNVKTKWWNGDDAAAIDMTNEEARTSYFSRLITLREQTGLDGYKFDAGESGYLPQVPDMNVAHQALYTTAYIDQIVAHLAEVGNAAEARCSLGNQRAPLFVRMHDKDTRWELNNGLRSVVTTLLQMNMVGYPMVLADMIGGNGYGSDVVTAELFIRWLQASVFTPSLQFSYVPWQFNDPSVVEISKKFVDMHYDYSDLILSEAVNAAAGGLPVNLPICFAPGSAGDPVACSVDDEYLLGERLLVAPVMEPGKVTRDIYLPAGIWQDMNTGLYQEGPILIKDYPAPLDVLPYFMGNLMSTSSNVFPAISTLLLALLSSLFIF